MVDENFAISVQGLTKRYGTKTVVQGLSINVPTGTIYGFLGPNGTGKTTTLRMLCGLLTPDEGEGICLGYDLRKQTTMIKNQTGYMPQKFGLYDDLTLYENLLFVARLYNLTDPELTVKQAIARLGMCDYTNHLARHLSGGWRQRLALAACSLHKPRLLLLDEPTAGVDPKARREFWDEIHNFAADGVTILVSTHYMDEAERCHNIGYLLNGRLLLHGSTTDVVQRSGLSTWRITTSDDKIINDILSSLPEIEMFTNFGDKIHVVGMDVQKIERAMAPVLIAHNAKAERVQASLEDVFIHTMQKQGLSSATREEA
ncbi:MAG: ABC transporter ATP-binding protein [Proteobacteria bacterium]|jgi:ABC-2 type transport system ATP-binding protein|nr:ABC transporter ATP-binding protein [Alphaproteobacteria bacterium]NCC03308.1 ABC transporter ATP-binding protein [Pseudomonadota bacterium]